MMNFLKFPSLTNTDREDHVERKIRDIESRYPSVHKFDFVIMEKYDGANLGLHYNGETFRIASRNQFVDETFYNCGAAIERARPYVEAIWNQICEEGDQLTVFGELIGPKVQGRVRYTEEVDFVPFRHYINGEPQWLLTELFPSFTALGASIPSPRILKRFAGTVNEAVEQAKAIVDSGLRSGVDNNQVAEGVVVHFDAPILDANDSLIMFKCKDPSFKEDNASRKPKKVVSLTEEQQVVFNEFMSFINDSRVYSVISKIGTVTPKDFGRLMGLTIQDALEDSEIDSSSEEWKAIAQMVNKEVAKEIRPVFLQNMEIE